jgi:hypothetical protein
LYGCGTWSLTLREEHRLRVFENRVLRRIFGPRRGEIIGGWRKLRNEELHNFHSSLKTIGMIRSRRMRWARHVARMVRRGMHTGCATLSCMDQIQQQFRPNLNQVIVTFYNNKKQYSAVSTYIIFLMMTV